MADVFISYARENEARAESLERALVAHGIDVWRDRSIGANERFEKVIRQEISRAKAVLVCWTPAAANSEFVEEEADTAKKAGKYVGCLVEPTAALPMGFNRINSIDLLRWNETPDDMPLLLLLEPIGRLIGGEKGSRIANLAEAKRRAEGETQAAKEAIAAARNAQAEYEKRQHEIEAGNRQREAERLRQRALDRQKSLEQRLIPFVRPYCSWLNPVTIALVSLLNSPSMNLAGGTFVMSLCAALVISGATWLAIVLPSNKSLAAWLFALTAQWAMWFASRDLSPSWSPSPFSTQTVLAPLASLLLAFVVLVVRVIVRSR